MGKTCNTCRFRSHPIGCVIARKAEGIFIACCSVNREYWEPKPVEKEAAPAEHVKPPLGVMPEYLWLETRVKDLCSAISRDATTPEIVQELRKRLQEMHDSPPQFIIPKSRDVQGGAPGSFFHK